MTKNNLFFIVFGDPVPETISQGIVFGAPLAETISLTGSFLARPWGDCLSQEGMFWARPPWGRSPGDNLRFGLLGGVLPWVLIWCEGPRDNQPERLSGGPPGPNSFLVRLFLSSRTWGGRAVRALCGARAGSHSAVAKSVRGLPWGPCGLPRESVGPWLQLTTTMTLRPN